jgi:nucleotide-binding universal stress UspA family protein
MMADIKTILVPVDFSENTGKLLEYAAGFAEDLGAKLTLINVVDTSVGLGFATLNKFEGNIKKDMEAKMAALSDQYKDIFSTSGNTVVIGDAVDSIVAAAKNCDMVVIATHGYKGLEKILLGSVAERVLKASPCPVVVFNPYK